MRKIKGFALLEIIVVILIIGVLAAIIIPRIGYSKRHTEAAAAITIVSEVNAILEYAHLTDGVPYPADASEFQAFLNNTTYFPDGNPQNGMPGNYVIMYNIITKRAMCLERIRVGP